MTITQCLQNFVWENYYQIEGTKINRDEFINRFKGYAQQKIGYAPETIDIIAAMMENRIIVTTNGEIVGLAEMPKEDKESMETQRNEFIELAESALNVKVKRATRLIREIAEKKKTRMYVYCIG